MASTKANEIMRNLERKQAQRAADGILKAKRGIQMATENQQEFNLIGSSPSYRLAQIKLLAEKAKELYANDGEDNEIIELVDQIHNHASMIIDEMNPTYYNEEYQEKGETDDN